MKGNDFEEPQGLPNQIQSRFELCSCLHEDGETNQLDSKPCPTPPSWNFREEDRNGPLLALHEGLTFVGSSLIVACFVQRLLYPGVIISHPMCRPNTEAEYLARVVTVTGEVSYTAVCRMSCH